MQDTRMFAYDVHTSRTFLLPPGLDATLYLILLRVMRRQYAAAFQLAESVVVDVDFTPG